MANKWRNFICHDYRLLNVILMACAAWILAQISWQLISPPQYDIAAGDLFLSGAKKTAIAVPVSYSVPRGLFGTATPTDKTTTVLPLTTLPLTLTGLLASSEPHLALAVILWQGKQASYASGDTLPVGGVRIREITADGVVLSEPGGMTMLRYADRPHKAVGRLLPDKVRQQLTTQPTAIADYLAVSPVREGEKLRGYRINPGRKPELFSKLSFEAGDLAVAINGADLRDSQQAGKILLQLPQLRTVTVSVERDGQRHDISISLDEGT